MGQIHKSSLSVRIHHSPPTIPSPNSRPRHKQSHLSSAKLKLSQCQPSASSHQLQPNQHKVLKYPPLISNHKAQTTHPRRPTSSSFNLRPPISNRFSASKNHRLSNLVKINRQHRSRPPQFNKEKSKSKTNHCGSSKLRNKSLT